MRQLVFENFVVVQVGKTITTYIYIESDGQQNHLICLTNVANKQKQEREREKSAFIRLQYFLENV